MSLYSCLYPLPYSSIISSKRILDTCPRPYMRCRTNSRAFGCHTYVTRLCTSQLQRQVSIKFPSRKISSGVKLRMAASQKLELSSETSTFTDDGLWIAIPLFVMQPNVNVFSVSGFSRSIVKETESLSFQVHHSESEYSSFHVFRSSGALQTDCLPIQVWR